MPAFKKLGPSDQIDNVLVLEPAWNLASGTAGWRGSPEGSASLNLWGGYNRQPGGVVQSYKFQRIIQGTDSFGTLARSEPLTASVHYVWMTDEDLSVANRSAQRWGHEHWKTVGRLYDFYSRRDPDYTTASYDYYCLYFNSASNNIVTVHDDGTSTGWPYALPTGSFTLETWFNPFVTSSSGPLTLMSHARGFQFFVAGDTGRLALVTYSGSTTAVSTVTSSVGPVPKRWHHAAVTFDSTTLSGTFYLDLQNVGTFVLSSSIPVPAVYTASLQIGSTWGGTVTTLGVLHPQQYEDPSTGTPKGTAGETFHGFMGECRVWGTARTWSQISSSYNHRLSGSVLLWPLLSCVQFNEGPLAFGSPTADNSGLIPGYAGGLMGSGVLDVARSAQGHNPNFGNLYSFGDRVGPTWHPNGNVLFYPNKALAPVLVSGSGWSPTRSQDVKRMLVLSVPAGFYGRRISPESVSLTCHAFSSPSYGLVRTLIDDGRGNLFISGSAVSASFVTGSPDVSSYRGVEWNKVGNVFYDEGLVVIRDPSLLDFALPGGVQSSNPNDLLQFSFRGHSRVPVKTLMCRIDRGDLNSSLNPTYWTAEEDGTRVRVHPSGNIYVTTVGLYNSDHELVGVARLAEPLRVRPRDRMNVRLRMDF